MKIIKRYKNVIIMGIVLILLIIFKPDFGKHAINTTFDNIWQMLKVVPPVFVLISLMDVWISKEKVIKHIGYDSGIKGIILSFLLGSATAGPLYASFPIARMLLKKGTKFLNVMIFVGSWSTTKIYMTFIEGAILGWKFTLTRFFTDILGIIIMAFIIDKFVNDKDKNKLLEEV